MAEIQDFFLNILSDFSGFLWGVPMIVLLFGTHLFLTFRTGGVQRHIGTAIKMTLSGSKAGGDISNFSALMVAMAATVGTGNALMAIPNIISLLLLSGVVASETKKYLNKDRINEYDPTIEH